MLSNRKAGDLVFQNMSRSKSRILFLLLIGSLLLVTGCFNPFTKDTKVAPAPTVGVIDINKALKLHPRYQQLTALQQEFNMLRAKLEAGRQQPTINVGAQTEAISAPQPVQMLEEMDRVLEQEYDSRMAAQKAQINEALLAKAGQVRRDLQNELQVYSSEVNKVYEPQIFDIQLKIKTVQLSKEDMAKLQTEMERLQGERDEKIAVKQRELADRMDKQMAPEQAAAEKQLAAYSAALHGELAKKAEAKMAEMARRNVPTTPAALPKQSAGVDDELSQQLAFKQQEIESLQQFVIDDIRSKAGKVAAERGLDMVLAEVRVNVSAVDITDAVIGEFAPAAARF